MRQLRQQRCHEREHHELAGHLQGRNRQQKDDHAVAPDVRPGFEIDGCTHQATRQAPRQKKETETADQTDAAVSRAPTIATGDECDQRQADRGGERPSEKDIGNGAAALLRRLNESAGAGRLRCIKRADRQHDQTNNQQADVIGRKRRGDIGEREHGKRRGEQGVALDPAGQPCRQRRAHAQHNGAKGDQQAGVADRDTEP